MPYQRPPVIFHRKFTKPRVKIYRAADRGVRFAWNRYDTVTIGCGLVLPTLRRRPGAWCVSLVWAKPVSERVVVPPAKPSCLCACHAPNGATVKHVVPCCWPDDDMNYPPGQSSE